MANQQAVPEQQDDEEIDPTSDEDNSPNANYNPKVDYKAQYQNLKKQFKFLLYENEFFQDAIRSSQRRLLKVTRDRSFLLDRLLQYEKPEATSSESDDTESSDESSRNDNPKRRKMDSGGGGVGNSIGGGSGGGNGGTGGAGAVVTGHVPFPRVSTVKRRKNITKKQSVQIGNISGVGIGGGSGSISGSGIGSGVPSNFNSDGHMTAEEVERHLQSRQSLMELVPEKAPPTVPTEMFSNEPSLEGSESNDQLIETSGEDCLSVDMNMIPD